MQETQLGWNETFARLVLIVDPVTHPQTITYSKGDKSFSTNFLCPPNSCLLIEDIFPPPFWPVWQKSNLNAKQVIWKGRKSFKRQIISIFYSIIVTYICCVLQFLSSCRLLLTRQVSVDQGCHGCSLIYLCSLHIYLSVTPHVFLVPFNESNHWLAAKWFRHETARWHWQWVTWSTVKFSWQRNRVIRGWSQRDQRGSRWHRALTWSSLEHQNVKAAVGAGTPGLKRGGRDS